MATNVIDDYETLCERGRLAAEDMDKGRWTIGDLACDVDKRYGSHMIDDFAREVNVGKSSVKSYRTVCRFYEKDTRVTFLEDNPRVTFTHMRYAMKLNDAKTAYAFLEQVSLNGWTTDEALFHLLESSDGNGTGKPVKAVLSDFAVSSDAIHGLLENGDFNALKALAGKRVKVTFREATE